MQRRGSGKRSFASAHAQSSPRGPGGSSAGGAIELELKPVQPREEGGWQLWCGRSGRLFWYHPEHNLVQWETPDTVRCESDQKKNENLPVTAECPVRQAGAVARGAGAWRRRKGVQHGAGRSA